jgi:hypothetical protein
VSKGTPMIGVRIPPDVREMVELVIAHRNAHTRHQPWTLSDFTALALIEKVRKMARSRGRELEITVEEVVESFEPKPNWQATLFD